MFKHIIHSHLEFQFLMLTLGMILTFLALYGWVCWREARRGKAPKFSENLRRRLQTTKQKLKRCHNDKGGAA
jgi:predicted negative regulator of RcsB-dependent stress response